jgi:hypothetical protein
MCSGAIELPGDNIKNATQSVIDIYYKAFYILKLNYAV